MHINNKIKINYYVMNVIAIIIGTLSIIYQFLWGWEILSFMLSIAVIGGIIGGENYYEEQERKQLIKSFRLTFE
jgi:cbb3-type cytochrome oxidase subunit 1